MFPLPSRAAGEMGCSGGRWGCWEGEGGEGEGGKGGEGEGREERGGGTAPSMGCS